MGLFAELVSDLRARLTSTTKLFGVSQLFAIYSADSADAALESSVPLRCDADGNLKVVVASGDAGGGGEDTGTVTSFVARAQRNGTISSTATRFIGGIASNSQDTNLWLDLYEDTNQSTNPILHVLIPAGAPQPINVPAVGGGIAVDALSYAWSTSETTKDDPAAGDGLSVTIYLNPVS